MLIVRLLITVYGSVRGSSSGRVPRSSIIPGRFLPRHLVHATPPEFVPRFDFLSDFYPLSDVVGPGRPDLLCAADESPTWNGAAFHPIYLFFLSIEIRTRKLTRVGSGCRPTFSRIPRATSRRDVRIRTGELYRPMSVMNDGTCGSPRSSLVEGVDTDRENRKCPIPSSPT